MSKNTETNIVDIRTARERRSAWAKVMARAPQAAWDEIQREDGAPPRKESVGHRIYRRLIEMSDQVEGHTATHKRASLARAK